MFLPCVAWQRWGRQAVEVPRASPEGIASVVKELQKTNLSSGRILVDLQVSTVAWPAHAFVAPEVFVLAVLAPAAAFVLAVAVLEAFAPVVDLVLLAAAVLLATAAAAVVLPSGGVLASAPWCQL